MPSLLDRHLKIPKYLQLAEALRRDIESGVLRPGDRLPSYVEMKKRFGATQNTVDKIFNLLEKDSLIVREPSRGTFVSSAQNSPQNGDKPKAARASNTVVRNGIIGVSGRGFHFDAYATYWAEILRGIRQVANAAGVQVLLLDHATTQGWEKADGVIVCDYTAHEILDRVAARQPRVSLMVDAPHNASVLADDYSGERLATQHLLDLGHRRIAFLHGADVHIIPRRLAGYRDALAAAGVMPQSSWARLLTGPYNSSPDFTQRARESVATWLQKDWSKAGCTALLCHNDASALGAIEALSTHGLRVPEDVSVVGFDGADAAPQLPGGLTTIEVPLREIGARSAEVLLRQIAADAGAISDEHHVFPSRLRIGGTTAPLLVKSSPARFHALRAKTKAKSSS